MNEGPYRSPARPHERRRPQGDREALALLALLATTAAVPVVGDLVAGETFGGGAGLGLLVAFASARGLWNEARRARRARQTRRRRDRRT